MWIMYKPKSTPAYKGGMWMGKRDQEVFEHDEGRSNYRAGDGRERSTRRGTRKSVVFTDCVVLKGRSTRETGTDHALNKC